MAFQLPFTDEFGDTYAQSYWRRHSMELRKTTATILFLGYENAAKKGKRPIGSKTFEVNENDFATYFSEDVLKQAGVSPVSQAYIYARQARDRFNGQTPPFQNAIDLL